MTQSGDSAPKSISDFPRWAVESLCCTHPTKPLYHYTSAAGLLGIIESKSLWASGIQYLNDTTEFKHAASITRELLTEYIKDDNDPFNDLYRFLLRHKDLYLLDSAVFVASLSEEKDRLSQWRAYCSGGGGFSIGFTPQLIEAQAIKQGFYVVKCEYDVSKQSAVCAKLVQAGCVTARMAEGKFSEEHAATYSKENFRTLGLWRGFVEPIMRIAPALKNPSFLEEQEWRLVLGPFGLGTGVKFRASKYAVVPYVEFKLADENGLLEIEEIVIGPNPDPDQAQRSVDFLLSAKGVHCKRVSLYSGTYRNW